MARLIFLLVFGVAGCAVLLGLGNWQMQRLAWKAQIIAQIDQRIADAPVPLPLAFDPEVDRYMPVAVDGKFDDRELHVLVSRKVVGAGYLIIAPFVTADGRRILVDRGFVSAKNQFTKRQIDASSIVGNLHWPRETDSYTPAPDGQMWFARDVLAMSQVLNTEPVLLVAANQTDPAVTPIRVDSVGIPNDHLGYAVTWFSLAVIWAAMTGYFLWRTRAKTQG
jgi:surfeit locus 1 family protein